MNNQSKNQISNFNVFGFSMVELILTIFVAVTGLISMMGLFSIGLDSSKKAISESFAGDAGEQFLRFNSSKIKGGDWSWLNVFPNSKPEVDEPSSERWDVGTVFEVANFSITPMTILDPSSENNSGFFLLEQSAGEDETIDFSSVLRVWKDFNESEDGSGSATLHVEVSWPYGVPYDSPERQREVFSLDVFKAPDIALLTAIHDECKVTRSHNGGFITTIADVTENVSGSFTIELIVENNGCTGPDCLPLAEYLVEATDYSAVEVPSGASWQQISIAGNNLFNGFSVSGMPEIGGGAPGSFTVKFEVTELQDHQIAVKTSEADQVAAFVYADSDYVLNCASDDIGGNCEDPNNLNPPEWPIEDFTWTPGGTITVGNYFCQDLNEGQYPTDGDGTTLNGLEIEVCDGPSWLYWNNGNQLAGTPNEAGTFTWTLCVSDGCNDASTTMTLTVNEYN